MNIIEAKKLADQGKTVIAPGGEEINFRSSHIQTTRTDIFKLGEIVGTIETLLTIEEKQK